LNTKTKNKIEGWFYTSGQDNFSSFATLWIAFNAYYKDFYQRQGNVRSHANDRARIENIKSSDEHWQLFKSLISEPEFAAQIKGLKDEIKHQPLRKMEDNREFQLPDDDESVVALSMGFYSELMEIVYQIRNNLFHGEKEIVSERDRKLVTLAYGILHRFMAEIIDRDFQLPEAGSDR
jgi:hypothetical protein